MKTLSRGEMKNVLGGFALDHCTWSGLCANPPSINYTEGEGWAADRAQAAADAWCYANDCCTNVDCPGAA